MLQVENVSRRIVLVAGGRVAKTPWTRFKGLIGVRELPAGDGLLILPCNGIHCMWMSIPIDVLYCTDQDQVVAMDVAMKPWRIGKIYHRARYVLELPAGTLANTGTAIGDQLRVSY